MRCLKAATVAVLFGLTTATATAVDLISIDFESGNVGAAGSAGDGWKLWSVSGNNRSEIGSTGRTFLTGTPGNDEALFIKPTTPGASESDTEGAEFVSSTPVTVGQNDLVYLVTETFSDVSFFSDQQIKIDVRFGLAGDGSEYGGFDGTVGGSTWSVNSNFNTEPSASNRQGRMQTRGADGNGTTAELLDIKYVGDEVNDGAGDTDNNPGTPANNFLDRTFVQKTIYRPGAGDGTQVNGEGQGISFDGTNIVRTFNLEGTQDDANNGLELMPAYGNLDIDRVSVHMRRHGGAYDGLFVGDVDEGFNGWGAGHSGLSSPFAPDVVTGIIPNSSEMKIGIKSIRIGVATPGDLDLDADIDTEDITNVVTNFTGDGGSTTETWFDGDLDNDTDVDTADITDTVTNFTGASPLFASAGIAALLAPGVPDLLYNPANGEVVVDPDGVEIVSLSLTSAGAFIPGAADFSALDNAVGLPSTITDSTANQVGWTSALVFNEEGYDGGPFSLGNILPAGLTLSEFGNLFTDTGWARAGGGGGAFDIVVPEPSASYLVLAALGTGLCIRRRCIG